MKLFLQFGYGMKQITLEMAKISEDISVILSPRDMTPIQLTKWTKEFEESHISCYLDPQCYVPEECESKNLKKYLYWDSNLKKTIYTDHEKIKTHLIHLKDYNNEAHSKAYILPNILHQWDNDWLAKFSFESKKIIEIAHKVMNDKPLYMTLALPKDLLTQVEKNLEPAILEILSWDVDGFYLIGEAPDKSYLVDKPLWISNILQLCATLKIHNKKVIYGYGNHQMLPLALTGIDAMASGTWLNVRSFTNRFMNSGEMRQRRKWVYYPDALSEFNMDSLDWAYQEGKLESMKSKEKELANKYIEKLFNKEAQPSSIKGFRERDAFIHYLLSLKHQIALLDKKTFKEAFSSYEVMLNTAELELERLKKHNIFALTRSFNNVIDANRAAVSRLYNERSFALAQIWSSRLKE